MFTASRQTEKIEELTNRISDLEEEIANLRLLDEAVVRNNAMFEALIANNSEGIALIGPDRRIVRAIRPALGFSANDVAGMPLDSLIHPKDQAILIECCGRLVQGAAKTAEFEGRFCRPDGSFGWVSMKFTDRLDDPNVQAIVCNYSDTTLQQQRELILAEFATVVEYTNHAIFSKDLDGNIVTWNVGAQRLYGYSAEEIRGRHISILAPLEQHEEERSTREQVGDSGQSLEYRTIQVAKDGSLIPVLLELMPVLDRYGRTREISCFYQRV